MPVWVSSVWFNCVVHSDFHNSAVWEYGNFDLIPGIWMQMLKLVGICQQTVTVIDKNSLLKIVMAMVQLLHTVFAVSTAFY